MKKFNIDASFKNLEQDQKSDIRILELIKGDTSFFIAELKSGKWGSRLAPLLSALVPVVTERHFSFGYRPGNHRLLQKSVKDKTAAAGVTPIEPECKLLQVRLEVGRDKRTLMGA